MAAFRPDVLHVQCFGPNGAYATALARLTGVPLVVTLQGETLMDDADIFDISQIMRAALRAGLRGPPRSPPARRSRWTTRWRGSGSPRVGDRDPQRSRARRCRGRRPGRASTRWPGASVTGPYVLALGRVVEKKGFDLLLAGYAAMDPAVRTADLVIGGAGPAIEHSGAVADDSGIGDRVHFVGRLTREQVATPWPERPCS